MKEIKDYISEKLYHQEIDEKLIVNNSIQGYKYHPETKQELVVYIKEKIKNEGLGTKNNPLNLNDIDTSKITDMSFLFHISYNLGVLSDNGYFNISEWNVSNVTNMEYMFTGSKFTGENEDISKWDVSNVKYMNYMFYYSDFNGNISNWDVSKVEYMNSMFEKSSFTGKNGDISIWNVCNVKDICFMFVNCPLQKNPPKWYKSY